MDSKITLFILQRAQYSREAQEAQSLRTELNRLKIVATTLGVPPMPRSSTPAPRAATPAQPEHRQANPLPRSPTSPRSPSTPRPSHTPRPPSTSPTPSNLHHPSASLLSRFNSVHSGHMRSTSLHTTSRPSTPSISMAMRSQTPAPPPPPVPSRHRRLSLSHPSPPKMAPSTSEGKDQERVHQRWIPSADPDSDNPSSARSRVLSTTSASRTAALGRYTVPSMNAT
jgi:hypothetical protein